MAFMNDKETFMNDKQDLQVSANILAVNATNSNHIKY